MLVNRESVGDVFWQMSTDSQSVAIFLFAENFHSKSKPAGHVPPDAILFSGNKSMQKCLLLAEGYGRSRWGYGVQKQQRRRSGPVSKGLTYRCDLYGVCLNIRRCLQTFVSGVAFERLCVFAFAAFSGVPVPCAAAGSEWIKADQRNVLSERSEFTFRRLSSFRLREPCNAGQGFGGPLFAYFIWASK